MTLDEFIEEFRRLMNKSVDLPAHEVLREIEGAMLVLRREARFNESSRTPPGDNPAP